MSYQTLNSLLIESGYRNKKKAVLKDENGEYEWIEMENYEGKIEKVKKHKDPSII